MLVMEMMVKVNCNRTYCDDPPVCMIAMCMLYHWCGAEMNLSLKSPVFLIGQIN